MSRAEELNVSERLNNFKFFFRSLYHFDPSNPPTKASRYANSGTSRKKLDRQKPLSGGGKPNYRDNSNTNNNINNCGNSESEKSAPLIKQPLTHEKVNTPSNTDDQTDLLPLDAPKTSESSDDCQAKETEQCESQCELGFRLFIATKIDFEILLTPQLVKLM